MRRMRVFADRAAVERAVATDLLTEIRAAVATRGRADIVLTGGTVGIGSLVAVAHHPDRDTVDWGAVRVWWGDERFVPDGDPDRNDGQADAALLNTVPVSPGHVFRFPTADGDSIDVARARFDSVVRTEFPTDMQFDVVLNGIGPDGHVASLFPGRPHGETGELVIAVRDSPKPPSQRLSLTFEALNAGRKVWIVAAGEDKAAAIKALVDGASTTDIPATGLHGTSETAIYLDEAAASSLSR